MSLESLLAPGSRKWCKWERVRGFRPETKEVNKGIVTLGLREHTHTHTVRDKTSTHSLTQTFTQTELVRLDGWGEKLLEPEVEVSASELWGGGLGGEAETSWSFFLTKESTAIHAQTHTHTRIRFHNHSTHKCRKWIVNRDNQKKELIVAVLVCVWGRSFLRTQDLSWWTEDTSRPLRWRWWWLGWWSGGED